MAAASQHGQRLSGVTHLHLSTGSFVWAQRNCAIGSVPLRWSVCVSLRYSVRLAHRIESSRGKGPWWYGLFLDLPQPPARDGVPSHAVALELRPYQVEAIDRIVERGNLLLALTMGAGKTVAAVAAIRRLRRQRVVDCGVVFALKSTKWHWMREIHKADPRAKVQVVDGDKKHRIAAIKRSHRYHYTIMHYECLVNDWDYIKEYLPISFCILDEATYIKSFNAKRTRAAKALGKRCPVRIALSGQPVENRPEELFSLMEWVDKDVLGSFHKFDRTFIVRDSYGRPTRYRNLHLVTQRLGPAMYRKSREDIAEWLPEMIETEMPVVLDKHTMALHDLVKQDLSDAIDKAIAEGVRGSFDVLAHYGRVQSGRDISLMGEVMSRLLAMRMLSSHPALLRISADEFDTEVSRRGSRYASELKQSGVLDKIPAEQEKLSTLLETVENILAADPRHKVVVFSYFKPMLRMIARDLVAKVKNGPLGAGLTLIDWGCHRSRQGQAHHAVQHRPGLPHLPVLGRWGVRHQPQPGISSAVL